MNENKEQVVNSVVLTVLTQVITNALLKASDSAVVAAKDGVPYDATSLGQLVVTSLAHSTIKAGAPK